MYIVRRTRPLRNLTCVTTQPRKPRLLTIHTATKLHLVAFLAIGCTGAGSHLLVFLPSCVVLGGEGHFLLGSVVLVEESG